MDTYSLLPRLIPVFRQRYPGIELELRESTNLELLALLAQERLDVGLVRYPTASASTLHFQMVERDVFSGRAAEEAPSCRATESDAQGLGAGAIDRLCVDRGA